MAKELYVGQISDKVSEEDLRRLFSVAGTVTSVHLIVDPETRQFKHCGYVQMAPDTDLRQVVETLDGALLLDMVITVSIARPQKPGMSKRGRPGNRPGNRKMGASSPGRPARAGQGKKPAGPAPGKGPAGGPKRRRP